MKKVLSLMLALVMLLSLAGCGSAQNTAASSESSEAAEESGPLYRVALMGEDAAVEAACKGFCEENGVEFVVKTLKENKNKAKIEAVAAAAEEGYNVLILPDSSYAGAAAKCSVDYPEAKFVALAMTETDILKAALGKEYDSKKDYNVADYYNAENTWCASYQEELPGYMAGYVAVRLGYTRLGFLGGKKVGAVQRYGYGFLQGVSAAADQLGIAKQVSVNYAYAGQYEGDPAITTVMDNWYGNGTQVVFVCGGSLYNSAAKAASRVGGKVIGANTDQTEAINEYGADMAVTSAMKNPDAAACAMLDAIILSGTWSDRAGQFQRLGVVSAENLSLNYVGLAESTQWNDIFTADDFHTLVNGIFAGDIVVSDDISAAPKVSMKVNYRKGPIMQ